MGAGRVALIFAERAIRAGAVIAMMECGPTARLTSGTAYPALTH